MKLRLSAPGIVLLVVLSGCGVLYGKDPCPDAQFTLIGKTSLRVGETATVSPLRIAGVSSGTGGTGGVKNCPIRGSITWRYDDPSVLRIEVPTGETTTVRAVGIGSATLSGSESTPTGQKELAPLRFTVSP